jgi:hypothetical protein
LFQIWIFVRPNLALLAIVPVDDVPWVLEIVLAPHTVPVIPSSGIGPTNIFTKEESEANSPTLILITLLGAGAVNNSHILS